MRTHHISFFFVSSRVINDAETASRPLLRRTARCYYLKLQPNLSTLIEIYLRSMRFGLLGNSGPIT